MVILTWHFHSQHRMLLTMSQHSQRLVAGILVGSAFLTGVDMFIVNVAFDEIGRTGAVAAGLGSALGGGLVQVSWHWAFWINLPVGLLLVAGAAVLAVAIGAVVLGIVQGNDWGWASSRVLGACAAALGALVVFARRTRRHPSPVIAPSLLAIPAFRWANLCMLLFNSAFGAALLAGILWMQQVWGFDALHTGPAVALGPLAVPITSAIVHRRFPAARPGPMIAIGSLLFAASAVWQGAMLGTTPAYWTLFLPGWLLGGVAVGLAVPNLLAAGTATLPATHASTGGGVVSMSRQVGLVLGIAVLVTVVDGALPETGFAHAWYAVAAGMTLAALTALRMDRVTATNPHREPASAGR